MQILVMVKLLILVATMVFGPVFLYCKYKYRPEMEWSVACILSGLPLVVYTLLLWFL